MNAIWICLLNHTDLSASLGMRGEGSDVGGGESMTSPSADLWMISFGVTPRFELFLRCPVFWRGSSVEEFTRSFDEDVRAFPEPDARSEGGAATVTTVGFAAMVARVDPNDGAARFGGAGTLHHHERRNEI